MANMVYNVNENATQVLAAKQVKENIFLDLVNAIISLWLARAQHQYHISNIIGTSDIDY